MSSGTRGDIWRIPWPDRFGEAWQRRLPALGAWLAELESRIVGAACDLERIDRPVFVCGLARSGSTMLLEWLSAMPGFTSHRYADYPLLWTPYWWNLLRSRLPPSRAAAVERAHGDGVLVTRESPEAFEEPLWEHFFGSPSVRADDVLGGDVRHPVFERQFRAHLAKLVCARGAQRYVGKGNYNTLRIAYLARVFGDARFLVPLRHPLAQVASLLEQDRRYAAAPDRTLRHIAARGHHEFGARQQLLRVGVAGAEAAAAARRAGRLAEAWLLQWLAVYGHVAALRDDPALAPRIRIVPYEALCAAPAQVLEALLAFVAPSDLAGALQASRERWAARFRLAATVPLAADAVDAATLARAEALYRRLLASSASG